MCNKKFFFAVNDPAVKVVKEQKWLFILRYSSGHTYRWAGIMLQDGIAAFECHDAGQIAVHDAE
jgi:restriction endonuclease